MDIIAGAPSLGYTAGRGREKDSRTYVKPIHAGEQARTRSRSRSPVVFRERRSRPTSFYAEERRRKRPGRQHYGSMYDDDSSNGYSSDEFGKFNPFAPSPRPPPSVRHRLRPEYSSSESDGYEEFVTSKVYGFVPSRVSSYAKSASDGTGSDQDAPAPSTKEAALTTASSATNPVRDVYQSKYTGDAFLDGSHSVELTTVLGPKKQRPPLFRWLHVPQQVLNLDQLSDHVSRERTLSETDRASIAKLLAEARKLSRRKHTADGADVKHMPPRCLQMPLPSDNSEKTQETHKPSITWLCVPYFSLEPYSGLGSSKNPAEYPNQTLWQAQYSGNPPERDMEQVVCQLNSGSLPPRTCFHISQLWCIVLDNCEWRLMTPTLGSLLTC